LFSRPTTRVTTSSPHPILRFPHLLAPLLFLLPFTHVCAQLYNPVIDVQHYDFSLALNDDSNSIRGTAVVTVLFRTNTSRFELDLAEKNNKGKGMTVLSVSEHNQPVPFTQDSTHLILQTTGMTSSQHSYTIRYEGIPADGLKIGNNKYGHRGFFGDNWPNRAHNWLPCVDDPSDKATLDWRITAPDHYQVVANGALQEERPLPNHLKLTHWKESAPLSPKIMVISVAGFVIDHPGDAMGVPVWNYVFPENKEIGFKAYSYPLQILPFYITHIGPYPFEKCGNVQSMTQFGGLENASAISYFENSVNSPGVESLMAHEIAHQWFGDCATETKWEHLWLSEGFATYMTHCYLENKYGLDTLKKGMSKDRTATISFEKKQMTPVVDTSIKGDYMQLLNPNSYQKGGWVLHMLRRRVGDSLFWKGISSYYATYRNRNANSEDFEKTIETVTGQDLHTFFHQWLYTPGHPHIRINWKYDPDKKALVIDLTQTQDQLFEFPLEYSADGNLYHVDISNKTTHLELPLPEPPKHITPDPNVNLLADFEIAKP
ncbi:MAG TPA: M1 family metallopeptidase, partial [Puia sp.]|nr:M1 family metallopeptidase [Puia sp.]